MGKLIIRNCGAFALPQLLLSVVVVGLVAGYLLAWLRKELANGERPWERTLDSLGGISTAVGLLGSVVGFIVAFGSFDNGWHVDRLTRGLAGAYWTTGVGIATALVASIGSFILRVLSKQEGA